MRRIEAKRTGSRADGLARGQPGLQRGIVQHRLNQHDVPRLARPCGRPCDQRAPREEGRLAGHHLFKRRRERRHRGFNVMERGLAPLDPFQDVGDGSQDAPQAGIGGERAKEGLRLHEPFRGCRDFLRRQQQQPVTIEKRAAVGASHVVEKVGLSAQRLCESSGRGVGQFGRRAVHHDHGQIVELRERGFERQLLLAPLQLRRDQFGRIGVQGEMLRRVEQRRPCQHDGEKQHDQRMAGAGRNNATDQRRPDGHKAPQERMRR